MTQKYSITKKDELVEISTAAGVFIMPSQIYDAYYEENRPKQDRLDYDFGSFFSRATFPKPKHERFGEPKEYEAELDGKIMQFVRESGIKPEEYLDKYKYRGSEKMKELRLPKEILDLVAREKLFYRFSTNGVDRLIGIEHEAIAGSYFGFFKHPFMGGYSTDQGVVAKAKEQREREVISGDCAVTIMGFPLYVKDEKRDSFTWGDYHARALPVLERLSTKQLIDALSQIYQSSRLDKSPNSLEDISAAKVQLKAVQFDKNLLAIPKPISLEFLVGKDVVARSKDRSLLSKLRPKKTDVKYLETIKFPDQTTHYIDIKTKDGIHVLREVLPSDNWVENYYRRVIDSLSQNH